jgi:hypothetical protein
VTAPHQPEGAPRDPEGGPVSTSGIWVALALLGAAALVFAVLVLTSGVLGG